MLRLNKSPDNNVRLSEFFYYVSEDNSAALDLCFVLCKAVDLSVSFLRDVYFFILVVLLS